ncbi:unnamed protein product [Peniophora sp. CBMAI 1063]|nr:unnamed protein product [Peniophora sp. CBMAI 1063]
MLVQDKRKQLLLDLLSALGDVDVDDDLEQDEGIRGQAQENIHCMDLVHEGVEMFHVFARELNGLDDALRNFSNSARLLGSPVDILSSTYHLRERLTVIRYLFRENAAHLFPQKISHAPEESLHRPAIPDRRRSQSRIHSNTRRLPVLDPPAQEDLPKELDTLARNMISFLLDFNDLLDYPDEALNLPVMAFEEDLKYWASCLKEYDGQLKSPSVRRYLHDLSAEMGEHLGSISRYLSTFNETCIPTIRDMQRHGGRNLLNLSMLATVFCAVAATTLQMSYNYNKNSLQSAVNGFWFTSIVLSIAAAGNSLLGLAWKQAMYRAPGRHVPWWVISWLRRSPLVFLVMAVTCFTIGLAIFSYSSGQDHTVVIVVAGVTGLSSIGFTSVITWYALERFAFARHYGSRLHELRKISGFFASVIRPCKAIARCLAHRRYVGDPEQNTVSWRQRASTFVNSPTSSSEHKEATELGSVAQDVLPSAPLHPYATRTYYPMKTSNLASPTSPSLPLTRFRRAVRAVLFRKQAGIDVQETRRASTLVAHLRDMRPTASLSAHTALVRHLQFSPDGQHLATSSWDRTSVISPAASPFGPHRTLAHPSGIVSGVAWSPDGMHLLAQLNRSVEIWTESGVCTRTIGRKHPIQSIAWLPHGHAFMIVEGNVITVLDVSNQKIGEYWFERLKIHGIAPTTDGTRVLLVGTLLSSQDGLRPGKGRDEKRIISYNMEREEIECQVPVLSDVRDIALAKSGLHALVSYACKAPQLWELETYKQRTETVGPAPGQEPPTSPRTSATTSRLSLKRTYYASHAQDGFSAPGCFGGTDDELVLCASKSGSIHIWDRDSGLLLHEFYAHDLGGGDITCIAWNPTACMFATGRHDGAVRVWSTTPPGGAEVGPFMSHGHEDDGCSGEEVVREAVASDAAREFWPEAM